MPTTSINIVNPRIDEYLNKVQPTPDPILREMQRFGEALKFPIVGPQVGRLLYVLSRSVGATRVLELGSGFGYSGVWFAKAVGPTGRVVLTELSKDNVTRARDYLKRAGLLERTQIETGNALDVVGHLPGLFDVIFNDIDKKHYPLTLDLIRPKLRLGGLFITDNVLWGGSVLGSARSADVRGVKEFTRRLMAAPDFQTVILPIRDGVSVSIRVT